MEPTKEPAARCGTVVVCLAVIVFGQGYLLRGPLSAFPALPGAVWVELVFCLLMLAALVWCWGHPKGWTTNLGCGAAFGVFALYAVFNLVCFSTFSQLYLAGINTEFPSWSKALVAMKLVLAIMAVIAGIPAAPQMEGREYADKMRQAVYKQEAEWAKGSAKGAKKDLESAVEKLRENLSPEELEELLNQLKADPAAPKAEEEAESVAEQWRGWGGGT